MFLLYFVACSLLFLFASSLEACLHHIIPPHWSKSTREGVALIQVIGNIAWQIASTMHEHFSTLNSRIWQIFSKLQNSLLVLNIQRFHVASINKLSYNFGRACRIFRIFEVCTLLKNICCLHTQGIYVINFRPMTHLSYCYIFTVVKR